jgi:hypothetical protein
MRLIVILFALSSCHTLALAGELEKESAPVPDKAVSVLCEPDPTWLGAIERLRLQPRPGEFQNGGISASIVDVCGLSAEDRKKAIGALEEYKTLAAQKAAKWEEELKTFRAEYEAKIVECLPEVKREQARKALTFSHDHWGTAYDREARFRLAFIERKSQQQTANPETTAKGAQTTRASMVAWLKSERAKAKAEDEEDVKTILSLLGPEDAVRLQQFNRHRPAAKPPENAKPAGNSQTPDSAKPAQSTGK